MSQQQEHEESIKHVHAELLLRSASAQTPDKHGYRGMSWNRRDSTWTVQIKPSPDTRQITVGVFKDLKDAACAYDAAAIKHHGHHARLNFPPPTRKARSRNRSGSGASGESHSKRTKTSDGTDSSRKTSSSTDSSSKTSSSTDSSSKTRDDAADPHNKGNCTNASKHHHGGGNGKSKGKGTAPPKPKPKQPKPKRKRKKNALQPRPKRNWDDDLIDEYDSQDDWGYFARMNPVEVGFWRGLTIEHVPRTCKDKWLEAYEHVGAAVATGSIGALKASALFGRLIMRQSPRGQRPKATVVDARLRQFLEHDFGAIRDAFRADDDERLEYLASRRGRRQPETLKRQQLRAQKYMREGHLGRALDALQSSGMCKVDAECLTALYKLFPTGRRRCDWTGWEKPDSAVPPVIDEKSFCEDLRTTTRSTAQTGPGNRTDWIVDVTPSADLTINENPDDDEGPAEYMRGTRDMCIGVAGATIDFGKDNKEAYRLLSSARLVTPAKKDGSPRPIGIGMVIRRAGARSICRKSRQALCARFGPLGQFATGTKAAHEKILWHKRLRLFSPTSHRRRRTSFTADERNGFNCIERDEIRKQCEKLPAELLYLRVIFEAYYSQDSDMYLTMDDGTVKTVLCRGGVHQGDVWGGVFFTIGMSGAWLTLRNEHPSAGLSSYADDVHGDAAPGCTTVANSCCPGFKANPAFVQDPDNPGSTTGMYIRADAGDNDVIPEAVFILQRWEYLALRYCGLEVRMDKCFATCVDAEVVLDQAAYGPIGCVDGFLVSGVPVGKPAWVAAYVDDIASAKVTARLGAANRIGGAAGAMSRAVAARACAGTCQIGHLLRCLSSSEAPEGFERISDITLRDAAERLGLGGEDYGTTAAPTRLQERMVLPIRMGGYGVRLAMGTARIDIAAHLGGWAAAAHGGCTTLGNMDPAIRAAALSFGWDSDDDESWNGGSSAASGPPSLASIVADPESHADMPAVAKLMTDWHEAVTTCEHLKFLAKMAAVGALPTSDFETPLDTAWEAEYLHGSVTDDTPFAETCKGMYAPVLADFHLKYDELVETMVEGHGRAAAAAERALERADRPEDHLSLLGTLCESSWIGKDDDGGGWSVQRLISRAFGRDAFESYVGVAGDEDLSRPQLQEQMQHRAHISSFAGVFLTILPSYGDRALRNDEFFWLCRARTRVKHPQTDCLPANCPCRHKTALRGTQGKHLRQCGKGGGRNYVHDRVRDALAAICKEAGTMPDVERRHVIKNTNKRPGDVIAHNVSYEDDEGNKIVEDIVIDVTVVQHDTAGLGDAQMRRRAQSASATAIDAEHAKRTKRPAKTADQQLAEMAYRAATARAKAGAKSAAQRAGTRWNEAAWLRSAPPKWVDPRKTMEEMIAAEGMTFLPIAFEHSGACGGALLALLKKLTSTGQQLRGHDPKYFYAKSRANLAMALHKASARAALNRAYNIGAYHVGGGPVDDGPLGAAHTHAPLHAKGSTWWY